MARYQRATQICVAAGIAIRSSTRVTAGPSFPMLMNALRSAVWLLVLVLGLDAGETAMGAGIVLVSGSEGIWSWTLWSTFAP